jgi:hypothetical protein
MDYPAMGWLTIHDHYLTIIPAMIEPAPKSTPEIQLLGIIFSQVKGIKKVHRQ